MSNDGPRQVASFNLLDVESEIQESTQRVEALRDRLVSAAEDKARALLEKALAERDQIREDARKEGHAQGLEEGLREGRSLGEVHLMEEQQASVKSAAGVLNQFMLALPDQLKREQELMLEQSQRDLLLLAMDIARLAAAKAVPEPGDQVRSLLDDLVRRLSARRQLVVEVHPDVMESLGSYAEEVRQQFDDIERLDLRGADDLELGAVRVSNSTTRLESSVNDTLARLSEEWGL